MERTTNINATVLAVGCYYAVREGLGKKQSIHERSFVSACFCARTVLLLRQQSSCIVATVNSLLFSSY